MSKNTLYNIAGIVVIVGALFFGTKSGATDFRDQNALVTASVAERAPEPIELLPALEDETALHSGTAPLLPITFSPSSSVPETTAEAAYVGELFAAEGLFEKDPEARRPIASITKLMTALVALEEFPWTEPVVMTKTALAVDSPKGTVKAGEELSVKDMVYAMMLQSSNEAAEALAEHRGRDAFIKAMNEKAAVLGLENTSFTDPTGISTLNQSTIRDLSRLMRYIYEKQKAILEISSHRVQLITELRTKSQRLVRNIHPFVGQKEFIGGKTGYTDDAKGNLLSIFEYKGRPFLVVVLSTPDRTGETQKLYSWLRSQ